jgi:RNA polymerase sigma factor (TIGR02999 family)
MRQILVDHFRHGQASKRGGRWQRVTLSGIPAAEAEVDFFALEEALSQLTRLDPRQAAVVELRFFGGLTVNEVAEVLRISRTTVEAEWRAARAWLARELRKVELQ